MGEIGSINEILQEVNENMKFISDEAREKRLEMETVKTTIKQQKSDYNREIKEYTNLMKMIMSQEKKFETVEKNIVKICFKQKMNLTQINNDFVKHFNDFASRKPEIIDKLIEFFGFSVTPFSLLKKIIKEEQEFRNIIEHSEILNSYLEGMEKKHYTSSFANENCLDLSKEDNENEEKEASSKIKEKILTLHKTFQNNLQYPFDCIFDYVLSIYSILDLNEKKEILLKKIDTLQHKKNYVFIGLKNLESEILNSCSGYRVYSKYIKSINLIFDRFKELKDLPQQNLENLNSFLKQLKDFKRINLNTLRKYDNMNSLTLKSEYSEEFSEIISHIEEYNTNNIKLTPDRNPSNRKLDKEIRGNILEKNKLDIESIENVIHGLTRINTDENKIKMKNAKKIKNKKLKLSTGNSDLDITDNNKKCNTGTKNLSKGVEIKSNRTKTTNIIFNVSKKKSSTQNIISPRAGPKGNKEDKKNNFSKTHKTGFRVNSKNRNSSKPTTSTIEKSQLELDIKRESQVRINPKERKLSSEISNSPTKEESTSIFKRDSILLTPTSQIIKIESSSTLSFRNINPTNSEKISIPQIEQLESVCEELMISSPHHKIQVRTSKLNSDKPLRAKVNKLMPDYLNLKIDKPINNVSGCCVSCV